MEDLKKAILVRNGVCVGAVGDKYFSTCPLGTVLSFAGQTAPHGYLLCDGASYKVADYPHLYAVIGNTYGGDTENFNVPDYRETVLVGVGENTTDTITEHDVYELGEFKDDQLQTHIHKVKWHATSNSGSTSWIGNGGGNYPEDSCEPTSPARIGTTTHGKQKGVTYIIKAFHTNEGVDSGVSDDVIEYVDNKVDGLISDTTTNTTSTWSSSKIDERFTSTYLIKDIAAGGENEKTFSFKIRKDYFASYYAKRTFLLSANIYSLGFSKPVICLVEIFRSSADVYSGYVVNLQDSRYTGVTVTVNGDYLEVVVTFNSFESSGCMVSCSSLSNVPIA